MLQMINSVGIEVCSVTTKMLFADSPVEWQDVRSWNTPEDLLIGEANLVTNLYWETLPWNEGGNPYAKYPLHQHLVEFLQVVSYSHGDFVDLWCRQMLTGKIIPHKHHNVVRKCLIPELACPCSIGSCVSFVLFHCSLRSSSAAVVDRARGEIGTNEIPPGVDTPKESKTLGPHIL